MIIKTKNEQKILLRLGGYNVNKRIQILSKYSDKKFYVKNIGEQFQLLGSLIFTLIAMPFIIIFQLFQVLMSLNYWELFYTKKNLDDISNIVEGTFINPNDEKEQCKNE